MADVDSTQPTQPSTTEETPVDLNEDEESKVRLCEACDTCVS